MSRPQKSEAAPAANADDEESFWWKGALASTTAHVVAFALLAFAFSPLV